jgi:hypothetical protein
MWFNNYSRNQLFVCCSRQIHDAIPFTTGTCEPINVRLSIDNCAVKPYNAVEQPIYP